MYSNFRAFALSFVGILVSTAVASAVIVEFNFDLTPEQVNAEDPIVSNGFGSAFVTLDTETNELTWDVEFQDLTSGLSNAHFHGPATTEDNAGILEGLGIMQAELDGMTSGNLVGSITTNDTARDTILDGLAYINLHTEANESDPNIGYPGGEIRGQVIPEPSTYALMFGVAALGGAIFWRRRRARKV